MEARSLSDVMRIMLQLRAQWKTPTVFGASRNIRSPRLRRQWRPCRQVVGQHLPACIRVACRAIRSGTDEDRLAGGRPADRPHGGPHSSCPGSPAANLAESGGSYGLKPSTAWKKLPETRYLTKIPTTWRLSPLRPPRRPGFLIVPVLACTVTGQFGGKSPNLALRMTSERRSGFPTVGSDLSNPQVQTQHEP
jgi:hypothetical protein